eukprot:COSAG04_NODE_441_length_14395_cov_27.067711_14_plen_85_part_01
MASDMDVVSPTGEDPPPAASVSAGTEPSSLNNIDGSAPAPESAAPAMSSSPAAEAEADSTAAAGAEEPAAAAAAGEPAAAAAAAP